MTAQTIQISLKASVWREGQLFIARCLQLDVASQGQTEEESLANLREAVELYLEPPSPLKPDVSYEDWDAFKDDYPPLTDEQIGQITDQAMSEYDREEMLYEQAKQRRSVAG